MRLDVSQCGTREDTKSDSVNELFIIFALYHLFIRDTI